MALLSIVRSECASRNSASYVFDAQHDGELEKANVVQRAELLIVQVGKNLNLDLKEISQRMKASFVANMSDQDVLDVLIRQNASRMIEEPAYGEFAAKLLMHKIRAEVENQNILNFSDAIEVGFNQGLLSYKLYQFVSQNKKVLDSCIDNKFNSNFTYFGLSTVYDRYLLRHPTERLVFEQPQFMFMRVACGVFLDVKQAVDLYQLVASFEYIPGSPTLFNAGTKNPQLSSCFLVDSPSDSIDDIYKKYGDVARLSKHGGGIGISYSRVRSRGSLIKGTNGRSSGIVPWLKTLDSSVAAVNQGGRRKGACCVYLETWHADIEDFLELRDNTGDETQRTHNLNLSNWVPDLFMKRVKLGEKWSLFDPREVPQLVDIFGEEFEREYQKAEDQNKYMKQIPARDLYARMMKTLAQTGNGWMTFKDRCNNLSNQTGSPGQVIHLSNLCTEILEVSSGPETAVCNLGSVNLSRHVRDNHVDYEKISQTVQVAVRQLNRVIDQTYYPIEEAANSNKKWRPVGLGVMGLQDLFFKLRIPFDSSDAKRVSARIAEEIYYHALKTSADLAEEEGPHENFDLTRGREGVLQFDLWGVKPEHPERFEILKERIQKVGLRNSLLIAIAPTATIASILGCYECIEPQVSNLFKRETLSGEFLQVNSYLVKDLKKINLWDQNMQDKIISENGSIQKINEIPEELKLLYRTAWEIPQKEIINLAVKRGPFIDQSQSLNLFIENPSIGKLSSMYFYAWQEGVKTCYYLRSRPATQIAKTKKIINNQSAVSCSLENPESCEACG